MSTKLYKQLRMEKGLTAVIGSGGKTTLIRRLAEELKGDGFTVIVTTSTKILIPSYCPLVCDAGRGGAGVIRDILEREGIAAVGRPFAAEAGLVKLDSPGDVFEQLTGLADYVLVEADGSKHLPIKAHAKHEPVIPSCAGRVIQVVGIGGVGRKVSEAVHRPQVFTELTGLGPDETVTAEAVAEVINREALCDLVYIPAVEEQTREAAEKLAELLGVPAVLEDRLWISDR